MAYFASAHKVANDLAGESEEKVKSNGSEASLPYTISKGDFSLVRGIVVQFSRWETVNLFN